MEQPLYPQQRVVEELPSDPEPIQEDLEETYLDVALTEQELRKSLYLHVDIQTPQGLVTTMALIDSGCNTTTVHPEFVAQNNLPLCPKRRPLRALNVDGSENIIGTITHEVPITFRMGQEKDTWIPIICNIAGIGKLDIILGHDFLVKYNPVIDWQRRTLDISFLINQLSCPDLPDPVDIYQCGRINYEYDDLVQTYAELEFLQRMERQPSYETFDVEEVQSKVPSQYKQFLHVFSKRESERLPARKPWDHRIELKPEFKPYRAPLYPMTWDEQSELDEWINEQVEKGYIRPSKSPMACPVFYIPKKDGKRRLVIDYQPLNKYTIPNAYPLPLIQEIMDALSNSRIFTKMDLRWGYYNIQIKKGDEWKAAFSTRLGLYEPLVMQFGLCNAPATFQRMMNEVFSDLIAQRKVFIYLDDILIHTPAKEGHEELIREVLCRLQGNDLYVKPEKCDFMVEKVEFLGVIVGDGKVEISPSKLSAINDWPVPSKLKEVQSFLGTANFCRRFIQGFSTLVRPLHDLCKKDQPWSWGDAQQKAFDTIKKAFTTAPVLKIADPQLQLRVDTDASEYAIGAVLYSKWQDVWHPSAFFSRSLSQTEQNYHTYDRECLAIYEALKEWRHYLLGAKDPFEIRTDHQNLVWGNQLQFLSKRHARWKSYFSEFRFTITHLPGTQNTLADGLSRRPDLEEGIVGSKQPITLFDSAQISTEITEVILESESRETWNQIKQGLEHGTLDKDVKLALNSGHIQNLNDSNEGIWAQQDGVILYKGKVYVPLWKTLRQTVIAHYHDAISAGHPGIARTLDLVQRYYWWPRMRFDIESYVKACDACQRYKDFPQKTSGKLQPLEVPKEPWRHISMDHIVGLPEAQGYNAILVVVDRFSKMIELIPTCDTNTSSDLAEQLFKNVWKHYGLPDSIVSDRGPTFISQFTLELYKKLGIKAKPSTAFHPQTDGQTEKINHYVETYLRIYCEGQEKEWPSFLETAQFAYNNAKQTSTGYSPFEVVYGRKVKMGLDLSKESKVPSVEERIKQMHSRFEDVEQALKEAQVVMKRYADQKRSDAPQYSVGDKVWLESKNLGINKSRKLMERRLGPFSIIQLMGPNAVKLKLPAYMHIHPVVNVSRIRPYVELLQGQKANKPPPIEVEGEVEYEVDYIKEARRFGRTIKFLVHWKGYSDEEDTWEPKANLKHADQALHDFYQSNPDALR